MLPVYTPWKQKTGLRMDGHGSANSWRTTPYGSYEVFPKITRRGILCPVSLWLYLSSAISVRGRLTHFVSLFSTYSYFLKTSGKVIIPAGVRFLKHAKVFYKNVIKKKKIISSTPCVCSRPRISHGFTFSHAVSSLSLTASPKPLDFSRFS